MMSKKDNSWKAAKVMVWVKTSDGDTWMCPKSSVKDRKTVSAAELADCVNESTKELEGSKRPPALPSDADGQRRGGASAPPFQCTRERLE